MKKWYIKERHNPQLGVYYSPMGQLTKKNAKQYEHSLYGYNYMISFDTKEEYKAKIKDLIEQGKRIQ